MCHQGQASREWSNRAHPARAAAPPAPGAHLTPHPAGTHHTPHPHHPAAHAHQHPPHTPRPCRVKFREATELQTLDANTQSGGERSVSTILYLIALQAGYFPIFLLLLLGLFDCLPAAAGAAARCRACLAPRRLATRTHALLRALCAGRDGDPLPSGGRNQPGCAGCCSCSRPQCARLPLGERAQQARVACCGAPRPCMAAARLANVAQPLPVTALVATARKMVLGAQRATSCPAVHAGMDPSNERKVFMLLVDAACRCASFSVKSS